MVVSDSACFAEIVLNKSPNYVEFFHQRAPGPVLLAYCWDNFVTISVLHIPQLESEVEEFSHENLTDVKHESSVLKLAWSPKTSMILHPVGLIFCTISLDHKLRLFNLDNKMKVSMLTLGSHSTFINDCAFEPQSGNEVASVGDDKKCRIWNVEECKQIHCIPLTSPGKVVQWNPNDLGKLMIAEQNGCIRLYNSNDYLPIFSLTCIKPSSGLSSCDWSITNPLKIGALIGKEWYVWDTSLASLPQFSAAAHCDGGQEFKWCHVGKEIFSTRGRPGNQTKIYLSVEEKASTIITTKIGCGLSWHNLIPVCAIGGNRKVLLYDMQATG